MMKKDKVLVLGIFALLAVFWAASVVTSQLTDDENTNYETLSTGESYNISASAPGYFSGVKTIDAENTVLVAITLFKNKNGTVENKTCSDSPGATPQPGCPGPTIPPPPPSPTPTSGPPPLPSASIKIDRAIIPIPATEGSVTPVSEQLLIKNIGSNDVTLTLKINGQSGLSLNPSRLTLSPNQEVPVFITGDISKLKANVYPNTLTITNTDGSKINGKASLEVAITITVKPADNDLFDFSIALGTDKKSFYAGNEIPVTATIKSIGGGGSTFDVEVDYELKYSKDSSGKAIFSDTDKVVGGPEETVTKAIKIPKDVKSGNYNIVAQLKDKGQVVAIATAITIYINGPDGGGTPDGDSGGLLIVIIIFMIAGIASAVVYVEKDKIWKKGKHQARE